MTHRTQVTLLLVLGGLWAGLIVWAFMSTPEPPQAPLTYVTGQKASRTAVRGINDGNLKIRMDLLDAAGKQKDAAFMSPKNIFSPLPLADPEAVAAHRRRAPPPVVVSPVPPGPTPEELAAQAAMAELAQFRYLGYLSRQSRDEAFLSKGKDLHIVRAGETIEQRVLVKTITPRDVTLQETRSHVEKTVSLAGEGK